MYIIPQLFIYLIAAVLVQAQAIDAGSPSDAGFQGGFVWNAQTAGYVPLGPKPWADLRYSSGTNPFGYSLKLDNGFYRVRFYLMEPNKTGAGQRLFTITANGQSSAALDLFKLAGLRGQYSLDMFVPVNNGVLAITFRSTLGNAVVSGFEVNPLALSDLVQGPLEGFSIKLRNGRYMDVWDESFAQYLAGKSK